MKNQIITRLINEMCKLQKTSVNAYEPEPLLNLNP